MTLCQKQEEKEGEKEQRKDDSCLPTINHFYTQLWYPFYVGDTAVEHSAPKQTAHHPTTVTHCTGLKTRTVPDPILKAFPVLATHQTVTTVTKPTAPQPTVTDPTVNNPTVLLPTVLKSTVPDPTVTNNPTMPKPTVTEPTVPKHTVMTTTAPQSTVGATPKTLNELTTTHLNLAEAYLNQYTMMTLCKFFPHYSHPPYPEKVKQQFHHDIV